MAWNTYFICGNPNHYEGEGGFTYDSIKVDECDDSYLKSDLGGDK